MARAKKEKITARAGVLYLLFLLSGLAIVVMILVTQWGANGRALRNLAYERNYKLVEVPFERGTIYATDIKSGKLTILACNSPFYNVYFDFGIIAEADRRKLFSENKEAMIDSLAAIFPRYGKGLIRGNVERVFRNVLSNAGGYRYQKFVRDSVSQNQLDRLRHLPIIAEHSRVLGYETYQPRYFPFGSLAGGAISGIGRAFDKYLTGSNGIEMNVHLYNTMKISNVEMNNGTMTKDTLYKEHYVPVKSSENRAVVNGSDVVTTLDVRMQDIVERELRAVMEGSQGKLGTGAIEGTAIVMSVSTGEIRAVANLTRDKDGRFSDVQNNAIKMRTEPGSTFKVVPLMALLEGGWDVNRKVFCENGKYTDPHKNYVEDTHPIGMATIQEIFEQSSNIGFVKMVESVYDNDAQKYVDFVKGLGIDTAFSMQLSGGARAIVKDPKIRAQNDFRRWDRGITLMKMAYGYAIELTPLHTLTLYNAIANGGRMLEPILVKEIRREGEVVERFKARVINEKICSDKTLHIVQNYLEGVIEQGTGQGAKSDRYRIAGKTGTAQVAQPGIGYKDRNGGIYYLASFVGYFPADKPEYSVIVAVKTYYRPGTGAKRYGAEFGVPVFKAMADQIFSTFTERETPLDRKTTHEEIVTKRTKDDIILTAETMPDVCGMGLKDAVYLLEKLGLKVEVSGYGTIIEQRPIAGDTITQGERVNLKLAVNQKIVNR